MSEKLPPGKTRPKPDRDDEIQDRSLRKALPHATAFDDLFRGGSPVWMKVGAAALATPLIVYGLTRRMARRGGPAVDHSALIVILALSVAVGAFLGASLSLKDIVETRLRKKKPVPLVLKFLYGMGFVSLLVFWVPMAIVGTFVITALTLM